MWDWQEIRDRLQRAGLAGERWGYRGTGALDRIQGELGLRIGSQLRDFVINVGNLRVDPFSIILAGDDVGQLSAVTETRRLWLDHAPLRCVHAVKLMDHAGEVYLYYPDSERVCAYDGVHPVIGQETLSWDSFSQFVDWVFQEAESMADQE